MCKHVDILMLCAGDSGEIPQGEGPATAGQDQVPGTRGAHNESICHHHQVTHPKKNTVS